MRSLRSKAEPLQKQQAAIGRKGMTDRRGQAVFLKSHFKLVHKLVH